jgi:hypothetical protein
MCLCAYLQTTSRTHNIDIVWSTHTRNSNLKITNGLSVAIRTTNLPSPEFIEMNLQKIHNFQIEECLLLYASFIET